MAPISKLFLPPPGLTGCLMAGIYRDTRGADLSAADRTNHFPATPLVSVSLIQHGDLYLIPPGQDWMAASREPVLPRMFATGPQEIPLSSWAKSDVVALSVGVYPDAWHLLGGDSTWTFVPPVFSQAFEKFSDESCPDQGWRAFCDVLAPVWTQSRDAAWHRATSLRDWAKALVTRAALSGSGRGIRSIERRLKRYSGHTRRTLEFFAAFEKLHETSLGNPGKPLAEIALEAGYSDQSHMGRAVRRATGFSPALLNKAIATEEPFWCYRLLGERF